MNHRHCAGMESSLGLLTLDMELRQAVMRMSDPFAIVLLNKYALNITLNWLCNTEQMSGVHNRTLFFTLDRTARDGLLSKYPHLNTITAELPCLQVCFLSLVLILQKLFFFIMKKLHTQFSHFHSQSRKVHFV